MHTHPSGTQRRPHDYLLEVLAFLFAGQVKPSFLCIPVVKLIERGHTRDTVVLL
jgi:hypothetical protein